MHAHRGGGLQVDAEVVEEDALARLHVEQLARDFVEARFGFTNAHLAALDDGIEPRHHCGERQRPVGVDSHRLGAGGHHVVGEACGFEAGCFHGVERGNHRWANLASE